MERLKKNRNIVQRELYKMDNDLRIETVNLSNQNQYLDVRNQLSNLLQKILNIRVYLCFNRLKFYSKKASINLSENVICFI